jgi:hypothetical protein
VPHIEDVLRSLVLPDSLAAPWLRCSPSLARRRRRSPSLARRRRRSQSPPSPTPAPDLAPSPDSRLRRPCLAVAAARSRRRLQSQGAGFATSQGTGPTTMEKGNGLGWSRAAIGSAPSPLDTSLPERPPPLDGSGSFGHLAMQGWPSPTMAQVRASRTPSKAATASSACSSDVRQLPLVNCPYCGKWIIRRQSKQPATLGSYFFKCEDNVQVVLSWLA